MRVKLLTSRVTLDGPSQQWGEVIEVDAAEALRMIQAGQAEGLLAEVETTMESLTPAKRGPGRPRKFVETR